MEHIRKLKYESHHVYEVQFQQEMIVTDLKLYLGNTEQIQFKMVIKILGDYGHLVFFHSFEEQIFAQFASMIYQKPSATPADDGMHLTNLNYRGKTLRVIVEFGVSNSSMPRGSTKQKPPESLIEVYGQATDLAMSVPRMKELMDKQAQAFWVSKATLFSVGRSIPMLQIVKDA